MEVSCYLEHRTKCVTESLSEVAEFCDKAAESSDYSDCIYKEVATKLFSPASTQKLLFAK